MRIFKLFGLTRPCGYESLAKLVTAVYLSVVVVLIGHRWMDFIKLPLNELGDFAAGIFGPMAFLWLIVAYRQQGEELKISSKALESQVIELNKTFELQRDTARKQDVALDPVLQLKFVGGGQFNGAYVETFALSNIGTTCRNLTIEILNFITEEKRTGFSVPVLAEGREVPLSWDGGVAPSSSWSVTVLYKRMNGSKGKQLFVVSHFAGSEPIAMAMPDVYHDE